MFRVFDVARGGVVPVTCPAAGRDWLGAAELCDMGLGRAIRTNGAGGLGILLVGRLSSCCLR